MKVGAHEVWVSKGRGLRSGRLLVYCPVVNKTSAAVGAIARRHFAIRRMIRSARPLNSVRFPH